MGIKFELEAEIRSDLGKGASRRLRHNDQVPAIIYGGGEAATSVTLAHKKVIQALSHEAFYSHILDLKTPEKIEKVILKAVQRHPAKPRVQHIDFQRVRADQKLHMHIPLHFTGEEQSPAINEGGVFSHLLSDVEISCLPAHLPEYIEVDVSGMQLNDTLHLSNLKLPEGVQLVAFAHGVDEDHDLPVVSIHIPRVIEEETPVEAEVSEEEAAAATAETPETGKEGTSDKAAKTEAGKGEKSDKGDKKA